MPFTVYTGLTVAGVGVVILAVAYSASVFRGKAGERYSFLNHFISELGEWGVSRGAWAFNAGLVVTGLLLLPFGVHLGFVLRSAAGWVGACFAAVAALGASAVGIFTMNTLKRHVPAAMTFFWGGLIMAVAVAVAILTQPSGRVVVPKAASALSLFAAASFSSFVSLPRIVMPRMVLPQVGRVSMLDPRLMAVRPRFWILPFMEWVVLFATILWLVGMALLVP